MAEIIDGKLVSKTVRENLICEIEKFKSRTPTKARI